MFLFYVRGTAEIPPTSDWINWSGNSYVNTVALATGAQLDVSREPPGNNTPWASWSGGTSYANTVDVAPGAQLDVSREPPGDTTTWSQWSGGTSYANTVALATSMIEVQPD
jgi:hypothetical protein